MPEQSNIKKSNKTLIIIVVLFGVLILCCGACFIFTLVASSGDKDKNTNVSENKEQVVNNSPTTSPSEAKKQIEKPTDIPTPTVATTKTYKQGESAEISNRKITINSFSVHEETNEFLMPSEGKKFVVVDVEIENIGKSLETYNPLDFTLKDSKSYKYDQNYFSGVEQELSYGTFKALEKVRGNLVYEVPIDEMNFILSYDPGVFTKTKSLDFKLDL